MHFPYQISNPSLSNTVDDSASLVQLLQVIQENEGFPVAVLDENRKLVGVVSNGDVVKHLISNPLSPPTDSVVSDIMNEKPVKISINDHPYTCESLFKNPKTRIIFVVDRANSLRKLIYNKPPVVRLCESSVEFQSPTPTLIAEIGVNHDGNLDQAKRLIKECAESGIKFVKFQHRSDSTYDLSQIDSYDLGTQYLISQINKNSLTLKDLKRCVSYSKNLGLNVVITPFDNVALNQISDLEVDAIKIASCDLTNIPLILAASKLEKPLILSTGMSYESEIIATHNYLVENFIPHILLHCNSTYPTPHENVSLSYISRLKSLTGSIVGYSSHDGSLDILKAAVYSGASLLEFHVTLSRELEGTDHRSSVETSELGQLISAIRESTVISGSSTPRAPSQGEIANRISLSKSLALSIDADKGHIIKADELVLVSPGNGYQYSEINKLVGKSLNHNYKRNTILRPSMLQSSPSIHKNDASSYQVLEKLNFIPGIPVRYHDFAILSEAFPLSLFEFHMSDRDLNLSPSHYLKDRYYDVRLSVHAVEQYEDGFILDICSPDQAITDRSIYELERIVAHSDTLRSFFCCADRTPIIVNMGGFTPQSFDSISVAQNKTLIGISNLRVLADKYPHIEFLPQTMPPFPWHQGGRSFHNVLTSLDSIRFFLANSDFRICLDVSHSALSSFYFNEPLEDYVKILGDRIGYVHISDAKPPNGEGLQIGDGDLNLPLLLESIVQTKSKESLPLVSEIWQGHLNSGIEFHNCFVHLANLVKKHGL